MNSMPHFSLDLGYTVQVFGIQRVYLHGADNKHSLSSIFVPNKALGATEPPSLQWERQKEKTHLSRHDYIEIKNCKCMTNVYFP